MPSPNAADLFHSAAMRCDRNVRDIRQLQDAGPTPLPNIARIRQAIASNQTALAEFHRALAMPCQYPLTRNCDDPQPLHLEEGKLAQFIVLVGKVHETDGDLKAAAECYLDVYEFGVKMAAHSSQINWLTGGLLEQTATEALETLLNRCDPRTGAYIAQRMGTLYANRTSTGDMLQEMQYTAIVRANHPYYHGKYGGPLAQAALYHMANANWTELIADAARPPRLRGNGLHLTVNRPDPIYWMLCRQVNSDMWGFLSTIPTVDRNYARAQVALVKAHVLAYRYRTGVYPTSLRDLALPEDLIMDPFNDGPLEYCPPSPNGHNLLVFSQGVAPEVDASSGKSQTAASPIAAHHP